MADFTRFISYFYDYKAGERSRNLGFAKMEARQGMCRITVCLNYGHVLQRGMTLYAYTLVNDEVYLIRIGSMEPGTREGRWVYPADNIGGSGLNLEQLSGLVLLSQDRKVFLLSVWSDNGKTAAQICAGKLWEENEHTSRADAESIDEGGEGVDEPGEVEGSALEAAKRFLGQQETAEASAESAAVEPVTGAQEASAKTEKVSVETREVFAEVQATLAGAQEASTETREKSVEEQGVVAEAQVTPAEVQETPIETQAASVKVQEPVAEVQETIAEAQEGVFTGNKTGETEPDRTRYQVDAENDRIAGKNMIALSIPPTWKMLCKIYPSARPFDDPAWEVLCITLQDIGRLAPENWVWGSNHFLLHGFYQYRHLILARQRAENRVYLGVPGEFNMNEKFMAAMFGLHQFQRERRGNSEKGYWLVPVKL